MVKGSVQEKGGYLHTVISYTDKDGKRKQKWQSTGLTAKGNKRKAQELLKERIDELEMTLEREETQIPDKNSGYSRVLQHNAVEGYEMELGFKASRSHS